MTSAPTPGTPTLGLRLKLIPSEPLVRPCQFITTRRIDQADDQHPAGDGQQQASLFMPGFGELFEIGCGLSQLTADVGCRFGRLGGQFCRVQNHLCQGLVLLVSALVYRDACMLGWGGRGGGCGIGVGRCGSRLNLGAGVFVGGQWRGAHRSRCGFHELCRSHVLRFGGGCKGVLAHGFFPRA